MKTTTSPLSLAQLKTDALILFFQEDTPLLPEGNDTIETLAHKLIKASAFKGKAGQTTLFPLDNSDDVQAERLIVAGIGEAKHFHNGLLEQAAAAAIKAGTDAGAQNFTTVATAPIAKMEDADFQQLVGRGAAWGTYAYTLFKGSRKPTNEVTLTFAGIEESTPAIHYAEAQGAALLDTADLANMPGSEATPETIAIWAKSMAQTNNLSCQILDEEDLQRKGCGAMLSVAQGSINPARMIILKHTGADPKAKPIVLVGKTVTFDSGGISLKPGKGMGWMRYDKSGGMAVLTAMQMIARMNLSTPVIGILGVVENMPGSKATRPGDIVRASNGKTIEVLNTDAEGRLVLADALALASTMNPRAIVDVATLTGAVIVALGSAAAAVLGNNEELLSELTASGKTAGERIWPLPIYKDYSDEMKSDFADLSNLCKTGGAGTATAAAFLQEFVPEEIPWAHIDIAGTAWLESAKPHQAPGATLFGARLLTQWVKDNSQ